jgi:uncharacterized cupredoxin-like copper-binding protein
MLVILTLVSLAASAGVADAAASNPLPKGDQRVRRKAFLAVFLASGAGLLAAGAHASTNSSAQPAKATTITVVAGKPSELRFQLSKSTKLEVGTYTFKVTNRGLGFHTFKFCTTPVKTVAKNTCTGKVTKTLHPGQTASFTVKITKAGKYEYLCDVPGHAAAGMKGLIGVGVAVKPAPPVTSTPTTTTPATTTPTDTTGGGLTANGCPAGTPPGTTIGSDEDGDEAGTGPDDTDGCL